mgnify:CR=1 FL=1
MRSRIPSYTCPIGIACVPFSSDGAPVCMAVVGEDAAVGDVAMAGAAVKGDWAACGSAAAGVVASVSAAASSPLPSSVCADPRYERSAESRSRTTSHSTALSSRPYLFTRRLSESTSSWSTAWTCHCAACRSDGKSAAKERLRETRWEPHDAIPFVIR